jgi:hypothetical protein
VTTASGGNYRSHQQRFLQSEFVTAAQYSAMRAVSWPARRSGVSCVAHRDELKEKSPPIARFRFAYRSNSVNLALMRNVGMTNAFQRMGECPEPAVAERVSLQGDGGR